MRIIDLQRRLREIGRIRIGEQVPTSRGKSRPAKLDVFRLTSRDRAVIDAAAETYGGTVEPWDAPDGQQWQVKTTTAEMPVTVPPGDMAFSQSYEQWTAGGCRVRCDGRWDHVGDTACHCDPTARACDIHSRLSVILHDLPGLGVWRLDTSGYYAAVELGGVVDLAVGHAEAGRMLPARLRLEQRTVKRFDSEGRSQTRRFAVPVLDLDVHPMQLASVATAGELASAGRTPVFEPVPEGLPAPPVAPVGEQVPALDAPRPARKGAASPIPATGAKPRAAGEVVDDVAPPSIPPRKKVAGKKKAAAKKAPAKKAAGGGVDSDAIKARIDGLPADEKADLAEWWKAQGFPPLTSGELTEAQVAEILDVIDGYGRDDDVGATDGRNRKMWALVAETGWEEEDRDRKRRGLISLVSEGRTESSKDLTDVEWDELFDSLDLIVAGSMHLHLRSNGEYELRPGDGK